MADYSTTFWLNLAQPWTIERSEDGTHTRIKGADLDNGTTLELLVVETPQQIADLVQASKMSAMKVVTLQCKETVEDILKLLA
jgi:hypothetical protein